MTLKPIYNGSRMDQQFLGCDLNEIRIGEPLPVPIYLRIDSRYITFRAEGDLVDRKTYERLELQKIKKIFIQEKDHPSFNAWSKKFLAETTIQKNKDPKNKEIEHYVHVREETERKILDIFHSSHPDKVVAQAIQSSKKLVFEVMKLPYASQPLNLLQLYSQGAVNHSVNISVLSVYLAMQMGYSHALVLQQIGAGGLLHDIGKSKVPIESSDSQETVDFKMLAHPDLGLGVLDTQEKVPQEVKTIVSQHHECFDGSGYPKKLRGHSINELTRIISIADRFDNLIAEGKGSLSERQRWALLQLDQVYYLYFDPQKLQQAIKILKVGI